jgi:hypothetical protein
MAEQVLENTLTSAIEKAVDTHKEELAQQDKSNVEIPEKKEESEEEEKEDKKEQEDQDEKDSKDGKVLIQALRDPQKATAVIDYLAREAGYTKQSIQTRADVKEAKGDILEILEKNLGEEFKFLAPKLAPAIKESLESLLKNNDQTGDLRARIEKQELKEIQQETAIVHSALAQEWFGTEDMPKSVVKAMSSAMDEFPPTDPAMAPERYYRKIFSMVVGELGLTKKGRSDRISRNSNDAVARNLTSQNRGVTPSVAGNPQKLSLKDAVALAMEQVEQSSKK